MPVGMRGLKCRSPTCRRTVRPDAGHHHRRLARRGRTTAREPGVPCVSAAHASGSGRAARTGPRRRTGSSGPSADARHLTPFPRYFSPAEPDMAQRQERQIVQSQLNLANRDRIVYRFLTASHQPREDAPLHKQDGHNHCTEPQSFVWHPGSRRYNPPSFRSEGHDLFLRGAQRLAHDARASASRPGRCRTQRSDPLAATDMTAASTLKRMSTRSNTRLGTNH